MGGASALPRRGLTAPVGAVFGVATGAEATAAMSAGERVAQGEVGEQLGCGLVGPLVQRVCCGHGVSVWRVH